MAYYLSQLEDYYHKNHTLVSLVFLTPFVGYAIASAINSLMHVHFGQRGVALLAPLCHIVPYLIFSFHPPYPVMVGDTPLSKLESKMANGCSLDFHVCPCRHRKWTC